VSREQAIGTHLLEITLKPVPVQVVDRGDKDFRIVPEHPKSDIALSAQQATKYAGFMAVIQCSLGLTEDLVADSASPILNFKKPEQHIIRNRWLAHRIVSSLGFQVMEMDVDLHTGSLFLAHTSPMFGGFQPEHRHRLRQPPGGAHGATSSFVFAS
jgi:hypothetical protein